MLAPTPKGNLGPVWNALAADAERVIMKIIDWSGEINYDITDGDLSDWYLVQTYPGQDVDAFRWLARRGFGVFQPMMQRVKRSTAILVQGREPMFPGWLFVFCRDMRKHSSRLRVCPGVSGILCDPATNRPIPIDEPEMNEARTACLYPRVGFIDRMRAWADYYNPNAPHARSQSYSDVRSARNIKRSRSKLGPKERRNLENLTIEAKSRDIWDEKQWEQVMKLDPGARIGMLLAVLKSASDAGGTARAVA